MMAINSRNYRINHCKNKVCQLEFSVVREIRSRHVIVEKGIDKNGRLDCNALPFERIGISSNAFSVFGSKKPARIPRHSTDQVSTL